MVEFKFDDAFAMREEDRDKYDVIHDKGTFDVVFMNKDLSNELYAKAMRHLIRESNPDSILVITSGNLTSTELDTIFSDPGYFEKVNELKS